MDATEFENLKRNLYELAGQEITRVIEYYAVKTGRLDDHVYAKRERLLTGISEEEVRASYRRLMQQTIPDNAIYLWRMKKAKGPPHTRTSEKAAKKADNLATMLEKKGNLDGAESQRERAQHIRHEVRSKTGG